MFAKINSLGLFGLNAFKDLGGSYAMGRYIAKEAVKE